MGRLRRYPPGMPKPQLRLHRGWQGRVKHSDRGELMVSVRSIQEANTPLGINLTLHQPRLLLSPGSHGRVRGEVRQPRGAELLWQ